MYLIIYYINMNKRKEGLVQSILKKKAIYFGDSQFIQSTYFLCQRESADQGTLAPEYLEVMAIIEHMQEKIL